MMTDYPFNIRDVLSALSIPIRSVHRSNPNKVYIDCPRCNRAKCEIRTDLDVFNCPACENCGGGMLELYAIVAGCSTSEANKRMRAYVENPLSIEKRKQDEAERINALANKPKLSRLAPKPVINCTYRTLLSLCELRKEHKNNLLKRGLTDKQIDHYGFKSVPWKNETSLLVEQLLEKGCTLKGVPGFYEDHGIWKMAVSYKTRGFFVPMINIKGLCLGMQIRRDYGKPKYFWFSSSNYNNGCNRTSIPTYSNIWNIGNTVCITEGGLKAYAAHCQSGVTFIGIAGVSQFSIFPTLFNQLKSRGVTTICDCFDMDYRTNPNVARARDRLKEEIIKAGFRYARYEWDENYKGIDDYFAAVPHSLRNMKVIY